MGVVIVVFVFFLEDWFIWFGFGVEFVCEMGWLCDVVDVIDWNLL